MNPGKVRAVARGVTIALMGAAVSTATVDGFAQSYAGLLGWAVEHGLAGWKADSFPLLVDLFVLVGELGLFLLAIDGHRLRKSALSWLDLLTPAGVAASGWGASLVFNVGHVKHVFSYQVTAAVPPLASMVGLLVLLRTLHRYVRGERQEDTPGSGALVLGQGDGVPESPVLYPFPDAPAPLSDEMAEEVFADPFPDTPAELLAWLDGRDALGVDEQPRSTAPEVDPALPKARKQFAKALSAGITPSVRAIKRELRVGHARAVRIRGALAAEACS